MSDFAAKDVLFVTPIQKNVTYAQRVILSQRRENVQSVSELVVDLVIRKISILVQDALMDFIFHQINA